MYRERLIGTQAFKEDAAGRSNKAFREFVSAASFWPHHDGAPEEGKRTLQGELEIRKGTKPSFTFPRFSLRVRSLFCTFPFSSIDIR